MTQNIWRFRIETGILMNVEILIQCRSTLCVVLRRRAHGKSRGQYAPLCNPEETYIISSGTWWTRVKRRLPASIINSLLVEDNHLRSVFFVNSTGSEPGSYFTLLGGGLQRGGEHAWTHFCRVKWHYIKSSISICGLLLLLRLSPKDGLCSWLSVRGTRAFCDLQSLLLGRNRYCISPPQTGLSLH